MKHERIYLFEGNETVYLDGYIADPIHNFTRRVMLVIPGGGYSQVCSEREGEPIAMAFMPYGFNAFVLHYTVDKTHTFPTQLIEVAAAIKYIKDHAEVLNIDPEELFVVGFSAGGHLCASAGILWKLPEIYAAIDMPFGYNKPKGIIPIYPVISTEHHVKSFQNLWATPTPTAEQLYRVSLEHHVDGDSVPAFIMHTANDQVVTVQNALALANAYSAANVPFELHIYPDAPHGSALANRITECGKPKWNNSAIAEWVRLSANWTEHLE